MSARLTTAGITAKTASIQLQRCERVFDRRLANLFKAFVVAGTAVHSVKILRDDWMIIATASQ
jgi:hypothetical protein